MNDLAHIRLDTARVVVLEAAANLKDKAEKLQQAITRDTGTCWVWKDPDIERPPWENSRQYCAWALTETDYSNDRQLPQDTLTAPGIIAVSPQTIELAANLNRAKQTFQEVCRKQKNLELEVNSQKKRAVTTWLRNHGYPRINRRQTYRTIRVIHGLKRISFSWCRATRMQRASRTEIKNLITRRSTSAEEFDLWLEIIAGCEDKQFAIVRHAPLPQARANIWTEKSDRPTMINTPTPIIISNQQPKPDIRALPSLRKPSQNTRQWRRVERTPLIRALGIHRYLAN